MRVRAALVSNRVTGDLETDLRFMEELGRKAGRAKPDLILFPETAPTGLANNDDPAHDLPFGQPVPGPITDRIGALARETGAHVGSGILERENDRLYDSAVLLDPTGKIILHYRRIQPQWHGKNADPKVYRQGEKVDAVETPFGKVVFLICGDLFDDGIVGKARELKPDVVLFPFARNFSDGSRDQARWNRETKPEYVARGVKTGAAVLMVNLIEDAKASEHPAFGGAMAIAADGRIIAEHPLGEPGGLIVDLE